MIITGEDVLGKSGVELEAALAQITALTKVLRSNAEPLDAAKLRVINSNGHAVFYVEDGRLVGCAQLVIYQNLAVILAEIETVVVDSEFRNRGIAEKLVRNLVEHVRERGLWRVTMRVEPDNIAALNLYKKIGFKEADIKRLRLNF